MKIRVTWADENGGERGGDLTRDELPDTADTKLPIVVDNDGKAYPPNELNGAILKVSCAKTPATEALIQDARQNGYNFAWEPV